MRGLVDGIESPFPFLEQLPQAYREARYLPRPRAEGQAEDEPASDALTLLDLGQFLSAFDSSLAPVFCTLDNLAAYFDPHLAPDDFLQWLATWVALPLDGAWSRAQERDLVAEALRLHRWRGTRRGLVDQVQRAVGGDCVVELVESGGASWSTESGGPLPGSREPHLQVRVHVPDPPAVDVLRLDRLVAAVKPAHLPHRVEVVSR